jgi:hypothetical protein
MGIHRLVEHKLRDGELAYRNHQRRLKHIEFRL